MSDRHAARKPLTAGFLTAVLGLIAGVLGLAAGPASAAPAAASQDLPLSTAPSADTRYVIGPGDSLQVFVWRNPELSVTVPVRPDGRISTPLVGEIVAVGKRPDELAADVEKALATYIRSPQVNIIVTNSLSASQQIRVVGQAVNPKSIPYREGMTVLDVVIAVGGLGQYAAGNRAKIVRRDTSGKTREIKVRLDNLVNKGDISQNLKIQPDDILIIPESRF